MPDRPNLVFVFSDQQRYDTMLCYGNDWIQTPHLNALASRSTVFRNAYVAQPVCTPSRAAIMTGLYPHAAGPVLNGMVLPADRKTIAELVSSDYLCGYYGKWHLGSDVYPQHGFTKWLSTDNRRWPRDTPEGPQWSFGDYHHHLIEQGFQPDRESNGAMIFSPEFRKTLPREFQMASYLGDRAADFIRENHQRPFILFVSTLEPHAPYIGPNQDLLNPKDLPVGPTFLKKPEGTSLTNRMKADYYLQYLEGQGDPLRDSYMTGRAAVGEDISSEDGWRRLRARYFSDISLVDDMLGKVTSALEQSGITDNTVVVFTSEHGDLLGDHGMLEKRSFYEESSRVPLLMGVPWISQDQRIIEGSMSQIDLLPTLLDLLSQPLPTYLHGSSLLPVLKGEATLQDEAVIVEWNGTGDNHMDREMPTQELTSMNSLIWRSIVYNRWKLNLCAGDQCELFDLNSDPYEENNLFDDPAQKDRIRELTARVRLWQIRTGDTAPLPAV